MTRKHKAASIPPKRSIDDTYRLLAWRAYEIDFAVFEQRAQVEDTSYQMAKWRA
jgi:hypothetical protein